MPIHMKITMVGIIMATDTMEMGVMETGATEAAGATRAAEATEAVEATRVVEATEVEAMHLIDMEAAALAVVGVALLGNSVLNLTVSS